MRPLIFVMALGIGGLTLSADHVDADQSSEGCREPEFVEICLKSLQSAESIEEMAEEKSWWSSRGSPEYLRENMVVISSIPTRRTKDGGASFNHPVKRYQIEIIEWDDTTYLSCFPDLLSAIRAGIPTKCDSAFPIIHAYVPESTSVVRRDDEVTWSFAKGPWRVRISASSAGNQTYLYASKYKLPEK